MSVEFEHAIAALEEKAKIIKNLRQLFPSEEEIVAAGFSNEVDYSIFCRQKLSESLSLKEREEYEKREDEHLQSLIQYSGGP